MPRAILIGVVAAVVFTVFSIIDCAVQPATRHRGVSKPVWIIITCIPVIGGILWFVIGRSRGSASSFAVPSAPEDDPGFLRDLDSSADQRIRRLEEELRQLDAEDDDSSDEQGDADTRGRGDGTNGRPDSHP
ncbi:MAG: PLD nuclease N-terminal domain-containing protein [Microbacterium sp.]